MISRVSARSSAQSADPCPLSDLARTSWREAISALSIFSNIPVSPVDLQRVEPTLSLALTTLVIAIPTAISFGVVGAAKRAMGRPCCDVVCGDRLLDADLRARLLPDLFVRHRARSCACPGVCQHRQGVGPFSAKHDAPGGHSCGRLYRAPRPHHADEACWKCCMRITSAPRAAKGVNEIQRLDLSRLAQCRRSDCNHDRDQHRAIDQRLCRGRERLQFAGDRRLLIDAIVKRDYPVIQGVVLLTFSFLYVIVNLLVDIAYAFLDPRIRYELGRTCRLNAKSWRWRSWMRRLDAGDAGGHGLRRLVLRSPAIVLGGPCCWRCCSSRSRHARVHDGSPCLERGSAAASHVGRGVVRNGHVRSRHVQPRHLRCRTSLFVGSARPVIAVGAGLFVGLVAGYVRVLDAIVMRIMDGLMAIPGILLAIAMVAFERCEFYHRDLRYHGAGDSSRGQARPQRRVDGARGTLC